MDQQSLHIVVTLANAAFTAFRIAAHVPQLIAVLRDPCGARAISVGSWVMFAVANLSNGVYALVIAGDWLMFGINLLSTASCAAIAIVAACKQRRAARQRSAEVPRVATEDRSGRATYRVPPVRSGIGPVAMRPAQR